MANSLSAKKRIRQNAKRRLRNRARTSAVKTQIKTFLGVAKEAADLEQIDKEYRLAKKKIDKLTAKGVIHKNTAARKKSQLSRKVNAIKAKAG